MQPLLPATTARHRRELSTRQHIRLSLLLLGAIATFAAIGVFGTRLPVQVQVVRWFDDRGIPLNFAGWALYAIPLCALTFLLIVRRFPARVAAGISLVAGVLAVAAMGRPRGLDALQWQSALGPGGADFVHAVSWTAYTLLGTAALATLAYLIRRPDHAGIRRLTILAGLVSMTVSLVAVIVA